MPTTGPEGPFGPGDEHVPLPDVGRLYYNGVDFNALYNSKINSTIVQDEAHRTTKWVETSLEVEGIVSLNPGDTSTDDAWIEIRRNLSAHAGTLIYEGNGYGSLNVNVPGGILKDVNWGPVPKIIRFRPLGAGRSAEIHWQVTVCIPELETLKYVNNSVPGAKLGLPTITTPIVQFNSESTLTYDEEGYSGLSIHGTLEIPLTRKSVNDRTLDLTVDDLRQKLLNIQIDLINFRVTRRHFHFSRDKRVCEWEFVAEEMPRMGLPFSATNARGTMSVKHFGKGGKSIMMAPIWTVSLRCTYTIRKDFLPSNAADLFYSLLWFRMRASTNVPLPKALAKANQPQQAPPKKGGLAWGDLVKPDAVARVTLAMWDLLFGSDAKAEQVVKNKVFNAWLTDFGFDEGLYLDSKTITFHATWVLLSTFVGLLANSGVWKWGPEVGGAGAGNSPVWRASVRDIMGARSWLANGLNPKAEVIVDMGGGL